MRDTGIRAGTEQGKEIVDALVSQSRENLRVKMSDYRTRKAEWEKRLALIQVRLTFKNSPQFRHFTPDSFVSATPGRWPADYSRHSAVTAPTLCDSSSGEANLGCRKINTFPNEAVELLSSAHVVLRLLRIDLVGRRSSPALLGPTLLSLPATQHPELE